MGVTTVTPNHTQIIYLVRAFFTTAFAFAMRLPVKVTGFYLF
jgi:hypothetical protein